MGELRAKEAGEVHTWGCRADGALTWKLRTIISFMCQVLYLQLVNPCVCLSYTPGERQHRSRGRGGEEEARHAWVPGSQRAGRR